MKKLAMVLCLVLTIPAMAQKPPRELNTAFDAVKRVPFIVSAEDGYAARKLDADKALDAASHELKSDEDKRLYHLLRASVESSATARFDRSYLELAIQCRMESMLAFSPDEMNKAAIDKAKKGTCVADFRRLRGMDLGEKN